MLTTNVSHNSNGGTNTQANVSGSLGEFNQFSYNGYGTYNAGGSNNTGTAGVSGTYRAPYAFALMLDFLRARAIPGALATFMPHARRLDHLRLRTSSVWAAS